MSRGKTKNLRVKLKIFLVQEKSRCINGWTLSHFTAKREKRGPGLAREKPPDQGPGEGRLAFAEGGKIDRKIYFFLL